MAADRGQEGTVGAYMHQQEDREWRTFHAALRDFPHSFQLQDQDHLSKSTCKRLVTGLLSDLQAGLSSSLETARTLNLLSFFQLLLGQPRDALQHTDKALALEGEEQNVVTLANQAVIWWKTGHRDKAKRRVTFLENLRNDSEFRYLCIRAKAELAFSYTRLGAHFCQKPIPLFKEVLAEARPPELWLWKFGLALTHRRMAHINSVSVLDGDREEDQMLSVVRMLLDVITNCACSQLQAKCYTELAILLQTRRGSRWQKQFEAEAKMSPVRACEKALELHPQDSSVLWKCGKIFRYANRFERSVELLQKSVDLKPTTMAYHHLGLTYKKLATRPQPRHTNYGNSRETWTSSNRPFRGNRSNRRGNNRKGGPDRQCVRPFQKKNWRMEQDDRESMQYAGVSGFKEHTRGNSNFRRQYHQPADSDHHRRMQGHRDEHRNSAIGQNRNINSATCTSEVQQTLARYSPNQQVYVGTYTHLRSSRVQRGGRFDRHPKTYGATLRKAQDDQKHTSVGDENAEMLNLYAEENNSVAGRSSFQDEESHSREVDSGSEQLLHALSSLSLGADHSSAVPNLPQSQLPVTSKMGTDTLPAASHEDNDHHVSHKDQSTLLQKNVQCLRNIVKTSRDSQKLNMNDSFVKKAMDAFKMAAEISEWENVRASYDLALLHRDIGEDEKSLQILDTIQQSKNTNLGILDKINSYEQAGLILKDLSMKTSDEEERKRLKEDGEAKLNMALRLCCLLCKRLPKLQHYIKRVWHSFPVLLKAAEESDLQTKDKLFEKARLFQLIRENRQAMDILQEIHNISPEDSQNPTFLKMKIENHVALGQYDQALTFIETLNVTAQCSATVFDDEHYVQKVYIEAGKAALLSSASKDSKELASSHFSTVFRDTFADNSAEDSSSEDGDSVDESLEDEWDLILLHEDSAQDNAEALANTFRDACGLRVTRMEEDCLFGGLLLEGIHCVMKRSKVILIVAGGNRISSKLRLLIEHAATRPSTVALLVEGDHVPKLIKSKTREHHPHCYMHCPPALLTDSGACAEGGDLPYSKVQALCEVFAFILGIPSH